MGHSDASIQVFWISHVPNWQSGAEYLARGGAACLVACVWVDASRIGMIAGWDIAKLTKTSRLPSTLNTARTLWIAIPYW